MFDLLAEEAKRQLSAPAAAFGLVAFGVLAFGLYVVFHKTSTSNRGAVSTHPELHVALFGGTFDPVHHTHRAIIDAVLSKQGSLI